MASQTHILLGPAGSGRTAALLERYRQALGENRPGSTLWLAPSYRAAAEVRGALLDRRLRACFSPGVMTFDQFADSVLRFAETPIRPVSGLMKRQLLRSIVERGLRTGEVKHFARIGTAGGFLDLLEQLITELKRLEIWPERFLDFCHTRGMTPKDRELAWIYNQYQHLLHEHSLYDAEGRFWSARACLREGQERPYERLALVIADGFTDFTTTQHEILAILAERVAELHISLPVDDERPDVFRKTIATAERLESNLPQARLRRFERWRAGGDLAHLESQLFKRPGTQDVAPSAGQVEVIHAASELRELEWVAGKIKDLLTAGQATPAEIIVVLRNVSSARELVREVFGRFGLPLAIEGGRRLMRSHALAALVNLLRLVQEDWPYQRVLSALNNGYYRPPGGSGDSRDDVAAAQRVVHGLQIASGRQELLRAVERAATREPGAEPTEDETEQARRRKIVDARRARPLLAELDQRLAALSARAMPANWAGDLESFARATGLLGVIDEQKRAHGDGFERACWDALVEGLRQQHRLTAALDEAPPVWDLVQLLEWIADVVEREQIAEQGDEAGRVRVLSAATARGLRVSHLFLAGLSESSFPQPQPGGLYSPADHDRLRTAGLSLASGADNNDDEMLLFYEVVTRATQKLYVSYAALDERAQPLLPSPYLVEVEQLFVPGTIATTNIIDPRPVPGTSLDLASPAGFRVAAVHSALESDLESLSALLKHGDARLVRELTAGLAVNELRRGGSFGPFEGLLLGDAARKLLARRYGPDRIWSASQLEQYATCPFQFLLDRVLRAQPLVDFALEIDFAKRGGWLHATLAGVHRRLNDEAGRPQGLPAEFSATLREYFAEALGAAVERESADTPMALALREIVCRVILRWSEQYHEQHRVYEQQHVEFDAGPLPAHFEVSFGLPLTEKTPPPSTSAALELWAAGESIRVSGRIDRVDLGEHRGQAVFNVIDYKTGRAPKLNSAEPVDGTALQLDLYALAAQRLLFAESAVAARAGYWGIRDKGFKASLAMCQSTERGVVPDASWEARCREVENKVVELVRGIRGGAFPVYSRDEECTSHCDYRTVCRVNQARALEKAWPTPRQS